MAEPGINREPAQGEDFQSLHPHSKLSVLISKQLDPTDSTPLNVYELKNYIYFGFSDAQLRPKYWKVLLNYYSRNQFKAEHYYWSSRQSYHKMTRHFDTQEESYTGALKSIDLDLIRTPALQELQKGAAVPYTEPIRHILLLYALTNRDIGYVQGMISLVLTLSHVLAQSEDVEDARFAEEDAFFMFNNLMAEIGPNFSQQCDGMPCGINGQMEGIYDIIRQRDPELHSTLVSKNIIESGVAMRWVLLLFSGEFSMDSVVWLWDRLLSDSYRFEILSYCSAASIILMRNIVLKASFERCMEVLQNISMVDEQVMFYIADVMRRENCNIVELIEARVNERSE